MNPKHVGDLSEAMILSRLLRLGRAVSKPIGDNQRYDFVIDEGDGSFNRVQCKTGRILDGAVRFPTCSTRSSGAKAGKHFNYKGQIDAFAIYCPDNDKCYMIGVDEVGTREGSLRLEDTKNGQAVGVRWAGLFEI